MELQGKSVALVFLFFCVAALGVFMYIEQLPDKGKVFQESFDDATERQSRGDPRARFLYQKALDNASNVTEEARAKLNVGTSNMIVDPVEGIKILKEVYANTAYPLSIRASALHYFIASEFQSFHKPPPVEAEGFNWRWFSVVMHTSDAKYVQSTRTRS